MTSAPLPPGSLFPLWFHLPSTSSPSSVPPPVVILRHTFPPTYRKICPFWSLRAVNGSVQLHHAIAFLLPCETNSPCRCLQIASIGASTFRTDWLWREDWTAVCSFRCRSVVVVVWEIVRASLPEVSIIQVVSLVAFLFFFFFCQRGKASCLCHWLWYYRSGGNDW